MRGKTVKRTTFVLLGWLASSAAASAGEAPSMELAGGRWFDGREFRARTVFVENGMFQYGATSRSEALALARLGAFDNATLLRMWCENTGAAIFPDRKIGRLDEGHEASFLVLGGDPLLDFREIGTIRLRVKQGVLLSTD
jgi:hypothetical protein